jgi:hypothetical protein
LIRVGSGGGHPVRERIIALPLDQKIKGRTVSDTIEDTSIGRVSATHSTARAQPLSNRQWRHIYLVVKRVKTL